MRSKELDNLLIQLGLKDSGALFFKNGEKGYAISLPSEIQTKLKLIQPDAIYIFNNRPFVLFFDLTGENNPEKEDNIHKKVWSFDNSPVVFIIKGKDIHIYNALNYMKDDKRLEEIRLSSEEERNQKFSFWNLQSGITWKWLQDEYLNNNRRQETRKRVNEKLFQNIKDVRNALVDKENDPDGSIPNSLILRLVFIRYLIDREVKIDEQYIFGNDLSSKRLCFSNLIQDKQRLSELFAILNNKFNGVLFKNIDIVLNDTQAKELSKIFKGEKPEKGTLFYGGDFYFDIFDFSIIPVEVISGIYESLIDPETRNLQAAVYTPAFLAEYILNDTVDDFLRKQNTSECKIFEVAAGSGIFLVQSLRKMIEKEIELNGNDDKKAFSEKIRNIAKSNLFGVDINEEALKVACFSIYIALLDYQSPKEIDIYKFPNLLNENLFHADFFDTEHSYNNVVKKIKPHYILGNPPWKKDNSKKHLEWVNKENIYNKHVDGEMEIAQSFLLRVKDFMFPHTKAALIVTSTIFYNVSSTTKIFKNKFLTTYCLDKFFDLSPVRRLIFEEKDSPASIVYFRLSNNDEYKKNTVNHQSVKINYFLKYFKMLVIEKFDKKEIVQKHFIENDWLFKVALYGNVLDFKLLKQIYSNKNVLKNYIDNKTIFGGDGILKGTPKANPFSFLIDMPIVENEEINPYYTFVNKNNRLSINDVYLEGGRKKELFVGEHIYLKMQTLNESEIVVSYSKETAVNRHDVITLTSEKEISRLKEIYSILLSDIHTYFQFLSTSAWGVSTRPAIKLKEYLSFPMVDFDEKRRIELINLVNQFLQPFEKHYKQEIRSESLPVNEKILSKINTVINDLYGIQGYEIDLINYVLNVSRYQFQENKQHLLNFANEKNHYRNREFVLKEYAEVYLQEFEKIYTDEFMQVEIISLNHFIAMNFKFLNSKTEEKIVYSNDKTETEILKLLANNLSISQITNATDPTKNLFIQKDIKGFEENSFYIIKPNEYKCWHRAMAWYDVAEFIEKIEVAELKRFNQIEE
jgi:methylase of polypeptide subunit release factors